MCAKTTVAPLDRIKILLQAHSCHYKHYGTTKLTHLKLTSSSKIARISVAWVLQRFHFFVLGT